MKIKTIGLTIFAVSSFQMLPIVNQTVFAKNNSMASKTIVKHKQTKAHSKKHQKNRMKNIVNKTTIAKKTYHVNTKPMNSDLNNNWEHDASKLDPIMNWETDNHGNPLIAPTHGPNHNIVYYRIDTNHIGSYLKLVNQAIAAWNQLGVISLQPAPDDSVEAMNISYNTDPDANNRKFDYGLTTFNYNHDIDSNPNVMTQNDIYIEPDNDNPTEQQQLYTIEHEIGHALGFAHDKSQYFNPNLPGSQAYTSSVMASFDDAKPGTYQIGVVPLGTREANNLKMHYNLQ